MKRPGRELLSGRMSALSVAVRNPAAIATAAPRSALRVNEYEDVAIRSWMTRVGVAVTPMEAKTRRAIPACSISAGVIANRSIASAAISVIALISFPTANLWGIGWVDTRATV